MRPIIAAITGIVLYGNGITPNDDRVTDFLETAAWKPLVEFSRFIHPKKRERGRNGTMRCHAKTTEFFRSAEGNPALMDGRTLALCRVNGPHDVHYPAWEMHPGGDELLIFVSGSPSVALPREGMKQMARLPPQAAFIVQAGTWRARAFRDDCDYNAPL